MILPTSRDAQAPISPAPFWRATLRRRRFQKIPSLPPSHRERRSLRTACHNPDAQKQPAVEKICEYVGLTLMAWGEFLHFRISACQHFHFAPSASQSLRETPPLSRHRGKSPKLPAVFFHFPIAPCAEIWFTIRFPNKRQQPVAHILTRGSLVQPHQQRLRGALARTKFCPT